MSQMKLEGPNNSRTQQSLQVTQCISHSQKQKVVVGHVSRISCCDINRGTKGRAPLLEFSSLGKVNPWPPCYKYRDTDVLKSRQKARSFLLEKL